MRKQLLTSLASILLVIGAFTFSANAASAAQNGFYSIKSGQEKYHSINDFKKMSITDKKNMFRQDYYIVAGPTIYPISSLLLPENELENSGKSVTAFEKEENVNLDEIANGPVNSSFEVTSIE